MAPRELQGRRCDNTHVPPALSSGFDRRDFSPTPSSRGLRSVGALWLRLYGDHSSGAGLFVGMPRRTAALEDLPKLARMPT